MKKIFLTLIMMMGMTMGAYAQGMTESQILQHVTKQKKADVSEHEIATQSRVTTKSK